LLVLYIKIHSAHNIVAHNTISWSAMLLPTTKSVEELVVSTKIVPIMLNGLITCWHNSVGLVCLCAPVCYTGVLTG